MKGDLFINGKDAWVTWGVNMGDGFLDAIDGFAPMKNYIENDSRAEHGKRVIVASPRVAARDLTLQFSVLGTTEADFRTKRKAFEEELMKGKIDVVVTVLGTNVYRLLYTGKSVSYALSLTRNFCKFSAKFEEPNPADRESK